MIIKYGLKDFKRNLGFNIFIILLISLTFIACIFASSAVDQKLKYYRIFSDILNKDGYYAAMPRGNFFTDPNELRDFTNYGEYFENAAGAYNILSWPDNRLTPNSESYAYRGNLIYKYEPMMSEGKWLSDVKPEAGFVHAVISPNNLGIKTGDIITQSWDSENGIIDVQVKIVGVFREGAKFYGIKSSNINADNNDADTFKNTYLIEDLFNNYYQSAFIDPILIYNYDELESLLPVVMFNYPTLVPFKAGLTEEQRHQAYNDLINFSSTYIPFSDIKAASLAEIRKQLIILIPVVIGLLVLTMISILSLTAISTHKQLKNYGVLYLCGSRWRQCAFINTVTIMIDLIFSAVVTSIAMKLLTVAGILETTIVRFSMTELLICVGVAVFVLIVSLIMPFAIIGKTQPKEILKEEE